MDKEWTKVKEYIGSETITLGPYFTYNLLHSPRHLLFMLSRYKFAAKMIGSLRCILELGCSEGIGTLLLAENSNLVLGVDSDKDAIDWATYNLTQKNVKFKQDNFLGKNYGRFDAVVALDTIEYIKDESEFLDTVTGNLTGDGVCIIGTPNAEADKYASEVSKIGHVNMFIAEKLKLVMEFHFKTVLIFSMNDEVVHTGFSPMAHYLIALGCEKK